MGWKDRISDLVDDLQEDVDSLRGDVSELGGEVSNLRSRLSDLESTVSQLAGLTSASALGVYLVEDPVLFVQAVIIEWVVGGFLSLAGEVGAIFLTAWMTVTDAFIQSGQLILEPFGIAGDSITGTIALIGNEINMIAGVTGPAAPFVAVVIWGMLVFIVAGYVRTILEVVQWI